MSRFGDMLTIRNLVLVQETTMLGRMVLVPYSLFYYTDCLLLSLSLFCAQKVESVCGYLFHFPAMRI